MGNSVYQGPANNKMPTYQLLETSYMSGDKNCTSVLSPSQKKVKDS